MGESGGDLAFGVVGGREASELREGVESVEEGISCVEVLACAAAVCLIADRFEELWRHYVRHASPCPLNRN